MFRQSRVLTFSMLFAITASVAGYANERPDPQVAASMSLTDAKNLIQRWRRFLTSDLSPDVEGIVATEFGPEQMTEVHFFPSSGVPRRLLFCRYETFEPYVASDTVVNPAGAHKGQTVFLTHSGDSNGRGCFQFGTGVPTHDIAMQVAAALLRWKNSTLAERQALSALEQQQFAVVVAAYHATTSRPEISEDVRRFRVMAETYLQQKRLSDAVDAYEDGLALAPWWPEGHFNAALALGELHYYDEAIDHMKKFIALVPSAPDARDAQDKIYSWQAEQQALPQ